MWMNVTSSVTVGTGVELVEAVNAAPVNERHTIAISKDIVLEKTLEIPEGKDILMIWYGSRDFYLIGANGMDTIIVKSGGMLTLAGTLVVTHAEGDSGRGVYVERDGEFNISGAIISGNSADRGGGVYNEGTFNLMGDSDRGGLVGNNTANLGGGVYNEGTFSMSWGKVEYNNATDSETSVGMGGGVYNKGTLISNSNSYTWGDTICFNVATLGGGVYNTGTIEMSGGQISGNTALSGEGNNVFNEEVVSGRGQFYLLVIIGVVAVVAVFGGLFFYFLKMRKRFVVKSLGGSNEGI
ncbi:MAG: hypothetical protein FWD52_02235 [Candidatus Bathyarchaeota archaeon]|nr:hypothetical protein [Candidatus Termiticorpusculum sp.]